MTTSPVLARNSIPIWTLRREATLNWLALGLLLAAWNATYNEVPDGGAGSRPHALRGYPYVSVRAMQRMRDGTKGHNSVNVL
jgi:hypothetical protein